MPVLYVAIGGALGAVLRYGLGLVVSFPFGTLAVNVIGSFVMGVVFVWLLDHPRADMHVPLIMTGALGAFTTFSAFSLDVFRMYEMGRVASAAGYVAVTVCLSVGVLFAAVALMRGLS